MGKLVKNSAFSQFNCFRPSVITNKYTSELVTVKCGHCEACNLAKSDARVGRLERVREVAKCTFFGTLTYADDFLPVMSFDNLNGSVNGTFFVKKVFADSYYVRKKSHSNNFVSLFDSENLFDIDFEHLNSKELELLRIGYHRVGRSDFHPFQFGYLRKADLQKFFKRLRYYLNNITDANLYYFACGEYGPQSLRPHYHFVISFNEILSYEEILACVSCSWQFGRVDLQSVQSSATCYVSGYLTSTQNLPSFLQNSKVRPFFLQSLEASFIESCSPTDDKEWFVSRAHERVVESRGKYLVSPLPSSFVRCNYPLPSRLGNKSYEELRSVFKFYLSDCNYYPFQKRDSKNNIVLDEFKYISNDELCRLCNLPIDNISSDTVIPRFYYHNYLWFKKVKSLAVERGCSVSAVLHDIVDWYNDEELYKLKRFYSTMETFNSPFDVVTNLIQYPQIFSAFRCCASFNQLPDYLRKSFDLQGLKSYLYDEDGNLKVDVTELYKMDGFVHFKSFVLEETFERVKTKGANDAYNLI